MNTLWILPFAYLAVVESQYEEETFKVTAGKRTRQGGPRFQSSQQPYRNYRSNPWNPQVSPGYAVNPVYYPVIYGAPATFQYPTDNGQIYSGYPTTDQRSSALFFPQQQQQQLPNYDWNHGRDNALARPVNGYYSGAGSPSSRPKTGDKSKDFLSPAFIKSINEAQNLWTATDNFDDAPHIYDYVGDICGVKDPAVGMPNLMAPVSYNIKDIPMQFDARAYAPWGMCKSLFEVRDQGSCGSCWAIAAVECMTDRICIASRGKEQFHLSTQDLLECCTSCGYGCDGGFPGIAWTYFKETGIVNGGEYNSTGPDMGCKPYEIAPCAHHTKSSTKQRCSTGVKTPSCERSCDSGEPYNENLHFGDLAYSVDKKTESIQLEIMNYGPVQASFEVYEDFLSYGSGVYFHVNGSKVGDHAVKILGWGTENRTAYWLCVNSWGVDWGMMGGFFKVRRGTDECRIESNIVAGKPKVKSSLLHPQIPAADVIIKPTPFVNGNIQDSNIRTIPPPFVNGNFEVPLVQQENAQNPLVNGNAPAPFGNGHGRMPYANGNMQAPFGNG